MWYLDTLKEDSRSFLPYLEVESLSTFFSRHVLGLSIWRYGFAAFPTRQQSKRVLHLPIRMPERSSCMVGLVRLLIHLDVSRFNMVTFAHVMLNCAL